MNEIIIKSLQGLVIASLLFLAIKKVRSEDKIERRNGVILYMVSYICLLLIIIYNDYIR